MILNKVEKSRVSEARFCGCSTPFFSGVRRALIGKSGGVIYFGEATVYVLILS